MKKIILPAFLLLVLVQWIIPSQIIWKKEKILLNGKVFKFQTQPIDPVDPIRGRYVQLNYKADTFLCSKNLNIGYGDRIYVELTTNKNGFAEIRNISKHIPQGAETYVEGRASSFAEVPGDSSKNFIVISYPFEEYYLDEYNAQEVDRSINLRVGEHHNCYAEVSVYKGDAVIKDLNIDGLTVQQFLEKTK